MDQRDDPLSKRKRIKRREIPDGTRFITFSCQSRMRLLDTDGSKDRFVNSLATTRARYAMRVYAWVVMPEHVHVLVAPEQTSSISAALRFLKQSSAQREIDRMRRENDLLLPLITNAEGQARFWLKGGGFDRNVRDESEFSRHVRYIHRNPVERGLVKDPHEWRWSSLS